MKDKVRWKILLGFIVVLTMAGIFSVPPDRADAAGVRRQTYEISRIESRIPYYGISRQTQYITDWDTAVASLRDRLLERQENITVYYQVAGSYDEELAKSLSAKLFADAESEEYAESPDAGDYLKWSTGGYQAQIGASTISGSVQYEFIYTVSYYTTQAQEQAFREKAQQVLDGFDLAGKTEYEIIKMIYDYITDHVDYDNDHLSDDSYKIQFTAYGALIDGKSVCQGYASLFYYLCRKCGISARTITGTGKTDTGDGPHAWSIVRLGDCYYNLDATWDASVKDAGYTDYQFFLRSAGDFEKDHIREPDYTSDSFCAAYPMSSTAYDPNTSLPTLVPTLVPTAIPTATSVPTAAPTAIPTATSVPTAAPTAIPTATSVPTAAPTAIPTATSVPTAAPTAIPTATSVPTPSRIPTISPIITVAPTAACSPTGTQGAEATRAPEAAPTRIPEGTLVPVHTQIPSVTGEPETVQSAEPSRSPVETGMPPETNLPAQTIPGPAVTHKSDENQTPAATQSVEPVPSQNQTEEPINTEPSAEITRGPETTWRPGVTQDPKVTRDPAVTGDPATTQGPAVTQDPAVTGDPAIPQDPFVTRDPTTTGGPAVTQDPATTQDPDTTRIPAVTKEPGDPQGPAVTKDPQPTRLPAASQSVEPSQSPDVSQELQTTQTPVSSEKPATEKPVVTKKPVSTRKPVATVKPVVTQQPQRTMIPSATDAPGNTTKLHKGSKFKIGTMTYKVLSDNEVELTRDSSKKSKVTIPANVKYSEKVKYKVVRIAKSVYKNKKKLKKVTIGKNVRKINSKAFYGCRKLKNIYIKCKKVTMGTQVFNKIAKTPTFYLQKKSQIKMLLNVVVPGSRFKIKK